MLYIINLKLLKKWDLFRINLSLNFHNNRLEKFFSAAHENLVISIDVILGCFGQKLLRLVVSASTWVLVQNLVQLLLSFIIISEGLTSEQVLFLWEYLGGERLLLLLVDFNSLLPDISVQNVVVFLFYMLDMVF